MADETQYNPNQSPFNSVEDVELYHKQIRARRTAKEAVSMINQHVAHCNEAINQALAKVTHPAAKEHIEKRLATANTHFENYMPTGESFNTRLTELGTAAAAEKNDTARINSLALDMTERVKNWQLEVGITLQECHQGVYDPRRNPHWR